MEKKLKEILRQTAAVCELGSSIRIGSKSKVEMITGSVELKPDKDVEMYYIELYLNGNEKASAHLFMNPEFFGALPNHKVEAETIQNYLKNIKYVTKRK